MKTVRGRFILGLFVAAAALALRLSAATPPAVLDREKLKNVVAAYLLNFANHVRWPDEATTGNNAPLIIAILGKDPFGEALDRALIGKTAAGRPIRAVRVKRIDQLAGSHIVFMDQPTRAWANEVADALAGRPVLLIAFEAQGGGSSAAVDIVVTPEGTVRYKLAITRVKRAGLSPSAGLLQYSLQGQSRPAASVAPRTP